MSTPANEQTHMPTLSATITSSESPSIDFFINGKDLDGVYFHKEDLDGWNRVASACNAYDSDQRLLLRAYEVLADIWHEWPGRCSPAGQSLLCDLRESIATANNMTGEAVSTGVRSQIVRAALAKNA